MLTKLSTIPWPTRFQLNVCLTPSVFYFMVLRRSCQTNKKNLTNILNYCNIFHNHDDDDDDGYFLFAVIDLYNNQLQCISSCINSYDKQSNVAIYVVVAVDNEIR